MNSRTGILLLSILFLFTAACQSDSEDKSVATIPGEPTPITTFTGDPSTTQTATPSVVETASEAPPVPWFEVADCEAWPSGATRCGWLYVLENRETDNDRVIRLHVAIVESSNPDSRSDPVIYLSGGPGAEVLERLYSGIAYYRGILKQRDVIFLDPRGVGFSEPSLNCPEVEDHFLEYLKRGFNDDSIEKYVLEADLACQNRLLNAGIDLSAYNSAEMAADVNDLTTALGYDEVNLFGVSYGTRTALTMMRDYPEFLRSVVLDSAVPIEADLRYELGRGADRALGMVVEDCMMDIACAAAYPNLEDALDELTARLETDPVIVNVINYVTEETHEVLVDRLVLAFGLFESLYSRELTERIPKMIYDTLDGRYRSLSLSLQATVSSNDRYSEGMANSVYCSDEGTFFDLEASLPSTEYVHSALRDLFLLISTLKYRICDTWGSKEADPVENQPVTSDIATLILAGDIDPVTPPTFGRLVADKLTNATYVEFPRTGHAAFFERMCAQEILAEFLMAPEETLVLSCIDDIKFDFFIVD